MTQVLILLTVFIAFAVLFARLGLGTILGFLVGGALVGPHGLGIVEDPQAVETLAELGVVFLLFNLGLELKLDRLRLFEARLYLLAVTQLAITGAVFSLIAWATGLAPSAAAVVGGGLALSSTAVVLQVLSDLGRTLTQLGRIAIAVLLVQDLAVGPLLVFAKVAGEGSGSLALALGVVLGKAAIVVVVVVVIARFVLRPALRAVASVHLPEVFAAATLLVVLGAAWVTEAAGLSTALGAFLAGLMVADTEFRHQVAADVAPFRGLLLGVFFITVGMQIDVQVALRYGALVPALALGILVVKALLLWGLAVLLGIRSKLALQVGGLLAQGSEFTFVLLGLAAASGLLAPAIVSLLTIAVALSMTAAPLAAALGRRAFDRLEGQAQSSADDLDQETTELHDHVVVFGFGQVGMAVTRHLLGLGIPVLVLDYDPRRVRESRARRLPVFFGNATRSEVLRAAHVGQARLAVVAVPDPEVALRIIELLRRLHPRVGILARAPDRDQGARLLAAGASAVALDGLTTALELAERVVLLYER